MGELGTLTQHISLDIAGSVSVQADNTISQYIPIGCPHCQEKFERRFVGEHEIKLCPKRPFAVRFATITSLLLKKSQLITSLFALHVWCLVPTSVVRPPNSRIYRSISLKSAPWKLSTAPSALPAVRPKLPRKDLPAHISDS